MSVVNTPVCVCNPYSGCVYVIPTQGVYVIPTQGVDVIPTQGVSVIPALVCVYHPYISTCVSVIPTKVYVCHP